MPMPVAAGLYGVLLGLGFTTFVLTFGVFALAGIAFALGDPQIGLAIGLAFGIGRAVPIALVAPIADREAGQRITEAMAGRPGIYRGVRFGDGLALLAAAAALVVAVAGGRRAHRVPSRRRSRRSAAATSSSSAPTGPACSAAAGSDIAPPRRRSGARRRPDRGDQGALDPPPRSGRPQRGRPGPGAGADALAVSDHWLVWRARTGGRDFMRARNVTDPASPGPEQSLGRAGGASQLGRPEPRRQPARLRAGHEAARTRSSAACSARRTPSAPRRR